MLIEDHWLLGVRRRLSPHADDRPALDPELVVLHGISLPPGEFGTPYVEQLFLGELEASFGQRFPDLSNARVSAHLFLRRDGGLTQFVPFHRRAWHAGVSRWRGRDRCNDFAIGIELEGTDDLDYADVQYQVLADVLVALRRHYPSIANDAVVGHEHIAPGRKTDPGPSFDWARIGLNPSKFL